MFAIRRKDNHKQIKASGCTIQAGGLGEYDPNIYEEVELDELPEGWEQAIEKPIATGKGLIAFMENYRSTLGRKEVKTLLSKLEPFFRLLNQSRCNPLPLVDLDEETLELKTISNGKEYKVVTTVIEEWKNTVRFV